MNISALYLRSTLFTSDHTEELGSNIPKDVLKTLPPH